MNRTEASTLNNGKLVLFSFRLRGILAPDPSPTQTFSLADTIARTSSPIPFSGEKEWNTPVFIRKSCKIPQSLALRHQPFSAIHDSDPYQYWRPAAFQPTPYLPEPLKAHTSYGPLSRLVSGEFLPDGQIPGALPDFFQDECYCPDPQEASSDFIAIRLQGIVNNVENLRLFHLSVIAAKIGSPARHIRPSALPIESTLCCEACSRQTTVLWFIQHLLRCPAAYPSSLLATPVPIQAAKTLLEDVVAPARCTAEPATRGLSTEATWLRSIVTEFTLEKSFVKVCYLCAQPVILAVRRELLKEEGSGEVLLLNDVEDIVHGQIPALVKSDIF
jgi:hypothetical protein